MSASELLLLKKSFERLDKQYKGAEEKIGEFRDKLREARLEIAAKDKQLDAARKLLTKLGSERSELALVAEQHRDLNRSLEAKLSLIHDAPEVQAKLHRNKRKIAELTAQLHEAQARLMMCEEASQQQVSELAVLRRALTGGALAGTRCSLRGDTSDSALGGLSGYDGHAQLLQALGRSQEESSSLAAQLAEGNRRTTALEQQVSHLESDLDRSVGARVAAEETLGLARREAGEASERAAELHADLDEMKAQLRRTVAHLQEVQSARHSAEEALEALRAKHLTLRDKKVAAERESRAQVESLRSELRNLADAAEAEVQQLQAQHSSREREWEAHVADLQRQVGEVEARLAQSGQEHEVEVMQLQSRAGALEASLEGSRLREASLEREVKALQEEVARLVRHNGELAANLAAARNEAEALSERAEEAINNTDSERRLRMQVQAQLEASLTRSAVREEQLAAEAGMLRNDLGTATHTSERIKVELKSYYEKLSDALARQGINERHIEELHATIQSLTKSKTKLQNTMLEQLSMFKSKLQQVEQENFTLRTALSSFSAAARSAAGATVPRLTRSPPSASTDTHTTTTRGGLGIFSTSSGSAGGASLSQDGSGNPGGVSELTASYLATMNAVRTEERSGGGVRPRVSGDSTTTATNSTILTPMISLADTGQGSSAGGGGGGGAGLGSRGGASYRAESSSLVFEGSQSEEPPQASLAHYQD